MRADAAIAAVVIGLTGHDDAPVNVSYLAPSAAVAAVVHDSVIAHAGALGGEAGITVLAGTGSVAVGNATAGGPLVRTGGWGYFFGDEGSALGIARDAIASAMRASDRGELSPLGALALQFFAMPDLRAIQHAFAHGELSRAALASFATEVLESVEGQSTASSLSQAAREVRGRAAAALAELAAVLDRRLPTKPSRRISYTGGVFRNDGMRASFHRAVESILSTAEVCEPRGDPLDGALCMAVRLARGEPLAHLADRG